MQDATKLELREAFRMVREYCQKTRYCTGCILNHGGTKVCDGTMPCDWLFNDEMEEIK